MPALVNDKLRIAAWLDSHRAAPHIRADLRTCSSRAMYKALTRQIEVRVETFFLEEQSEPQRERWVFGYRITIENHGADTVQLVSRYWRITDGRGRMIEVKGEGVVGEQPLLEPGESFQYTSGTPLPTPSGFMAGTYQMVTADGQHFDVHIPAFSLDAPDPRRSIH
jgi:ApaG protein